MVCRTPTNSGNLNTHMVTLYFKPSCKICLFLPRSNQTSNGAANKATHGHVILPRSLRSTLGEAPTAAPNTTPLFSRRQPERIVIQYPLTAVMVTSPEGGNNTGVIKKLFLGS